MINRRQFILRGSAAAATLALPNWMQAASTGDPHFSKIIILHTNDVHSRIDPFPNDGSRYGGLGGAARRATLIEEIRAQYEHVLLFDSGDIFQGTPYFNFFQGEPEIRLMQEMKYDATTMGNHDFDAGIEKFEEQIRHHASFPVVIANYDFTDTIMHNRYVPRHIIQKGDVKIGVTGVGIELDGLVPKTLYGNTKYTDPIQSASAQADILKHDEKCDIVVCLSHLGYKYSEAKVSDVDLARDGRSIDVILGGHTHTFMDSPDYLRNAEGDPVIIHQVGWGGIRLGQIEMSLERNRKNRCVSCEGIWVKPAHIRS